MKFLIFIATLLLLIGSLMAGQRLRKPDCVKACNAQFQSCKESVEASECAKEKKECKKACRASGKSQ
ncbi:Uncharacterised protein g1570 [Pycnogonum litorale]